MDQETQTSVATESQLPAQGADKSDVTGAGDNGQGQETVPRSYSEEEVRKIQSQVDIQIAKAKKEMQAQLAEVAKEKNLLEDAVAKQREQALISQTEARGGNVDAVKQVLAKERQLREAARKLQQDRADVDARLAQASEAIARSDALKYMKQYELSTDSEEKLLAAEDSVEMENIALKLALEKSKVAKTPVIKTDTGRTQTKGVDLSKMSIERRMAWALEHGDHEKKQSQ